MAQAPLSRRAVLAAAAAFGIVAEIVAPTTLWWALLDLAVGLTAVVASGSPRLTPRSRRLALVLALFWFIGTLDGAAPGFVSGVGALFVLAYRGPLLQLLLDVIPRRGRSQYVTAVTVAAWISPFLPYRVAGSLTAVLAGVVCALNLLAVSHAEAGARDAVKGAAAAAAALALVWGLGAANVGSAQLLLALTDVVVVAALIVAFAAAAGAWARGAERSLAIQLGPTRRPGLPLTAQLAKALADPALELRYRVPDVGWLNEQGREVPPPEATRRVTRASTPEGGEVVLLHGATSNGDPGLAQAAAHASALALEAARLDAEVRSRSRQVASSRRRILAVADDERRSLEQHLSDRVLSRLRRVDRLLTGHAREAQRRELWAAVEELVALGRGLYPPAIARTNLRAALREVAARLSVPVEFDFRGELDELPESHRAAVWFVCSEALTNIVRHANATRVAIHLNAAVAQTEIEVTDNGVGGASLERGLRGLADRVEALDGNFTLSSPRGGPTAVRAVLSNAASTSTPASGTDGALGA